MSKTKRVVWLGIVFLGVIALFAELIHGKNMGILSPAGIIASQERRLIFITLLLSVIVVVPVFFMLFLFAWKYREGNKKTKKYSPDWSGNLLLETIWWAIPCLIITVLAVITWQSSHSLDPYKTISSTTKPITIQVVALDWKWLFIYPDKHIGTINYFKMPVGTPVNFEITSDAPMNSFWIPQLGGQVYAMSGMITHLNLRADKAGNYRGVSANISGVGFAGMKFTAEAVNNQDYNKWVTQAEQTPGAPLDEGEYSAWALPSTDVPETTFSHVDPNLYDTIVMKYMGAQ